MTIKPPPLTATALVSGATTSSGIFRATHAPADSDKRWGRGYLLHGRGQRRGLPRPPWTEVQFVATHPRRLKNSKQPGLGLHRDAFGNHLPDFLASSRVVSASHGAIGSTRRKAALYPAAALLYASVSLLLWSGAGAVLILGRSGNGRDQGSAASSRGMELAGRFRPPSGYGRGGREPHQLR